MLLPVKAFATCLAAGSLDMLPGLGLSHTSQQLQSHANACTRNLEAMLAHQFLLWNATTGSPVHCLQLL